MEQLKEAAQALSSVMNVPFAAAGLLLLEFHMEKLTNENPHLLNVVHEAMKAAYAAHIRDRNKLLVDSENYPLAEQDFSDEKLTKFLQKAESLPVQWTDSDDGQTFFHGINDACWYKIENIVSKNELLLIAMMSLAETNFSVVKNRHGWINKQETKRNRCVSSFLSFDFF